MATNLFKSSFTSCFSVPFVASSYSMRPGTSARTAGTRVTRSASRRLLQSVYQSLLPGSVSDFLLQSLDSRAFQDGDEEKINHRIPHRFEPITNIGTNWCCHCGYMLPIGRKNARRCTECDITCHANCAHLVPDFCGMSMETANQLLRDWRDINRARGSKVPPAGQVPRATLPPAYSPSLDQTGSLPQDMERLRLVGTEPPRPETPTQQRHYPQQPSFDRRQPQQPLPGTFNNSLFRPAPRLRLIKQHPLPRSHRNTAVATHHCSNLRNSRRPRNGLSDRHSNCSSNNLRNSRSSSKRQRSEKLALMISISWPCLGKAILGR